MKKIALILYIIFAVVIGVLFLAPLAGSAECDKSGTTVVYINGIFGSKESAKVDKDSLERQFKSITKKTDVTFINGFNASHGGLDVVDTIAGMCSGKAQDYDFTNILLQLHSDLKTQKVLLVGYSEGSFYSNAIYKYLIDHGVDARSVAVYNVATPANTVAGGGKYVTSDTDKTIENVVKGVTGRVNTCNPLPANITFEIPESEKGDPFAGHYFSKDYLALAPDRIISDIDEALNKLIAYSDKNECFVKPQVGFAYKLEGTGYFAVDTIRDNPNAFATSPYTPEQMANIGGAFFNWINNLGQQVASGIAGIFGQINLWGASLVSAPTPSIVATTIEDSFYQPPPTVDFQVVVSPVEYSGTGGENINPITEGEVQDLLDNIQERLDIISQQVQEIVNQQNHPVIRPDVQSDDGAKSDNQGQNDNQSNNQDNSQSTNNTSGNISVGGGGSGVVYPKILISEVQVAGVADDKQEFVELYNPNDQDVTLSGWYLQRKTAGGASWATYASSNLFSGKRIIANEYFLIARAGYYPGLADIFVENAITSDNSFALKDPNGVISDKLGFGDASDPELLATINSSDGQSIGRKVVDTLEQDTNDNSADFELNTLTPRAINIKYVAPNEPPSDLELKNILISEVQLSGLSAKDEFIELYNPNDTNVNLEGFSLKKKNSSGAESVLVSSASFSGTISALGYFLIVPQDNEDETKNYMGLTIPNLRYSGKDYSVAQNNTILFYDKSGNLLDKVGFGTALDFEKQATINPDANQSIGRKAVEQDTDDNSIDFELNTPTPNAQNVVYSPPALGDTVLPIITLNGVLEITITVGDAYIDDGVTALDNLDGDITAKIVTSNLVDNNIAGDYTVTYNVTDSAGNNAVEVTRIVHVLFPVTKILINEVQTEGQTTGDEFIVLYNPNDTAIDLSGFALKKKTSGGTESNLVSSGKFTGIINSRGYFLIVPEDNEDLTKNYDSSAVPALRYSGASYSIASDNTVLLYNNEGILLDKVGFGTALDFEKQTTINPLANQSIKRKISLVDNKSQDTNDNSVDFEIYSNGPFLSNDTTVISSDYTVRLVNGVGTIALAPRGTAKADFIAKLSKGQADQTWDDSKIADPVLDRDKLVVTAQDGKTKATYTITISSTIWTQGAVNSFTSDGEFYFRTNDTIPGLLRWCGVWVGAFQDTYPSMTNGIIFGGGPCTMFYPSYGYDMSSYTTVGEHDFYISYCGGDEATYEAQNCWAGYPYDVAGNYFRIYFDGLSWSPFPGTDATLQSNNVDYIIDQLEITVPFGTIKADLLSALTPAVGATLDASGLGDVVTSEDTFDSTSQDGTIKLTYIITVLPDPMIAVRNSAHGTLTTVLASYLETDYTPENWIILTGFKTAGDVAIDDATDSASVTLAQDTAIAGMAGVEAI